jgi:uncharacterized membrane protein YeiH
MEVQALIIFCMEMAGTVAFAASGAMTGISRRMDVFGVCVLGVVTAVGGGMMRDVILGNVPGALTKPVYVVAAVITALLIFAVLYFKRDMLQGRFGLLYDRMMLVMDSVGLGIFTVVGVITGIRNGYLENTFLLTFLGTLTGVGGGLLRDMMAGVPPYIFVKHIYACASVAGALVCVSIYRGFGQIPAVVISSLLVVAVRFLAAHYRWNLPHVERKEE